MYKKYLLVLFFAQGLSVTYGSKNDQSVFFENAVTVLKGSFDELKNENRLIILALLENEYKANVITKNEDKLSEKDWVQLFTKIKSMSITKKMEIYSFIFRRLSEEQKYSTLRLLKYVNREKTIKEVSICSFFPICFGKQSLIRLLKIKDVKQLYTNVKKAKKDYYKYSPEADKWGKSLEEAEDAFLSKSLEAYQGRLSLDLAVVPTRNSELISGVIKVVRTPSLNRYILSYYRINSSNKGCMTIAVKGLSNFLIADNISHNLFLDDPLVSIDSENIKSIKVAEKSGYKPISDEATEKFIKKLKEEGISCSFKKTKLYTKTNSDVTNLYLTPASILLTSIINLFSHKKMSEELL